MVEMLNRNNQPEMGGWKNGISWRRRKEQEGEKKSEGKRRKEGRRSRSEFLPLALCLPLATPQLSSLSSPKKFPFCCECE